MTLRSLVLRVVGLMVVGMMTTGCCELIGATCDCIGCLLNGPSIPGLAVGAQDVAQATPRADQLAQPRGAVRAAMAY